MEGADSHQYQSYSWHQSHDQATVLLLVPHEIAHEEVLVLIEQNYLLAGVKGQPPIIKGRLYGTVTSSSSSWQLEPRASQLSARERTTSTTSTTSTQSSYAFVSDPEISSSFAASLESGHASEAEDTAAASPAYSSPISSGEREPSFPFLRRRDTISASQPVSPPTQPRSLISSFSSVDSLHSHHTGRLLTLHLDKEQPAIWPSLVVGSVPETMSPCAPGPVLYDMEQEYKYNMDPTSLLLTGLELFDIRKDKEEAFGCLVRAWLQAHIPTAVMKLVTYYIPLHASFDLQFLEEPAARGTLEYYAQALGGSSGLAKLYLEAGLLHVDGAASTLLSSSYSTLSSIRLPQHQAPGETGADVWRRDRDTAIRYFDRARTLQPSLDVPYIPSDGDDSLSGNSGEAEDLEMPSIEIYTSEVGGADSEKAKEATLRRRRDKKKEELVVVNNLGENDVDSSWYLYIPSLVGAGTALLVVGVVGALSFSSWRRNQGS